MYFNNPIVELHWPSACDPIVQSTHNGIHCLFYDPAVDKHRVRTHQSLQNLCDWANLLIKEQTVTKFLQDRHNHYNIANLVKLNIWVNDLKHQGIVKPMLLQYVGKEKFHSGNGESRLRAMERIPNITTAKAFISTHCRYRHLFEHLELVTDFDRFAELCEAEHNQQFLFRLTDAQAPYGIDWYEYDSCRTAKVTPGQDFCVEVLTNYLMIHPVTFTPEWFDHLVEWDDYKTIL